MTSHSPRLFEVSNATGNMVWEEIFDFDQDDMDEDDIMILDTYDTIYFWVGNGARREEKVDALHMISVRIFLCVCVCMCVCVCVCVCVRAFDF